MTEVEKKFGNRIRVRACGICIVDEKLLLVKHKNIGKNGYLWSPPGGGVSFGENVEDCLMREFKEETGLIVVVDQFLFVYEFVVPPFHAIELFFTVCIKGGELAMGIDPEMTEGQIIEEVKFCDIEFIKNLDKACLHKVLHGINAIDEIKTLNGFIK
jgi:8-oxo-dGTP diphosphatase